MIDDLLEPRSFTDAELDELFENLSLKLADRTASAPAEVRWAYLDATCAVLEAIQLMTDPDTPEPPQLIAYRQAVEAGRRKFLGGGP